MARRKESEKAATPLSDQLMQWPVLMDELKAFTAKVQQCFEDQNEHFSRTGICAIRDTCNVLIWQGAEADMEAQSEHLKALEAEVAKKVKAS